MTTKYQTSTLYNQDFNLWVLTTAEQLRSRDVDNLDWGNLIEEIETLGRSEKQALESNLRVLLMYLLKWKYQQEKRSNSWRSTIREHQKRIQKTFRDRPSLKQYFDAVFDESYQDARELAADETGLSLDAFPINCPFDRNDSLNRSNKPS
jgi:Domain of unknown function DUF29